MYAVSSVLFGSVVSNVPALRPTEDSAERSSQDRHIPRWVLQQQQGGPEHHPWMPEIAACSVLSTHELQGLGSRRRQTLRDAPRISRMAPDPCFQIGFESLAGTFIAYCRVYYCLLAPLVEAHSAIYGILYEP